MLWFGILALPAAFMSIALFAFHVANEITDPTYTAVIIPGTGILFGSLAFFSVLGGALCELITKTGDPGIHRLSSITASYFADSVNSDIPPNTGE
jgi:hypothetical protein